MVGLDQDIRALSAAAEREGAPSSPAAHETPVRPDFLRDADEEPGTIVKALNDELEGPTVT